MSTILFKGRRDGIGNRIEEVIYFSAICDKENKNGTYLWNNWTFSKTRRYQVLFTADKVNITQRPLILGKYHNDYIYRQKQTLSNKQISQSASKIKPIFPISFLNNLQPIGVHIRRGDRISKTNKHKDFMSEAVSEQLLEHTLNLINERNPKYLYICSDEPRAFVYFISKLNKSINILNPVCNCNSQEYIDFFALSLCKEIYMCSKFSSFAITASLIGNSLIHSYFKKEESNLERYKANISYDLL